MLILYIINDSEKIVLYARQKQNRVCVSEAFPLQLSHYFNYKFLYVADKKRIYKCYHTVKGSNYICVIVSRNSKCFTKSYGHLY